MSAQILGLRLQVAVAINFVWWHQMFVDPQNGTCVILPFLHLKFWDDSQVFGNFVHPTVGMLDELPLQQ